jgi:hypothetical protein
LIYDLSNLKIKSMAFEELKENTENIQEQIQRVSRAM